MFYDATHAFGSTDHGELQEAVHRLTAADDVSILTERIEGSTFTVEAADREVTMTNKQGGLMGSSEAPLQYLDVQCESLIEHNVAVYSVVKRGS